MGWRSLAAFVLLAPLCVSAAPPSGNVNYAPDKIDAETRFDSASRLLGMRCISALGGVCRFIIDDAGKRRIVLLRPRRSKSIKIMTADATMCVIGIDPEWPCRMMTVEPTERERAGH